MDEQKVLRLKELLVKISSLIRSPKNIKREEMEALGEDLLFWQTEFSAYLVEAEQAYRFLIRELMEKEDLSFAAAENKAKTAEIYALYKKTKYLSAIAEEKVRILKIMLGSSY